MQEGSQFSVPISKGQHADGLTAFGDIHGDGAADDLGTAVFINNPPVEPPIVNENSINSAGCSWSIIGVWGVILVLTQRRFLSRRFSQSLLSDC